MRRLALSAALAVLLVACETSHVTNVPVSDLGDSIGGVLCGAFVDCFGSAISRQLVGGECVTRFARAFDEGSGPALEEAIANGTVIYDGARAAACVSELEAAGCDVFESRFSSGACGAAIVGTIAAGGACSISAQCVGDAYCSFAAGACPGTCQARLGSGAMCMSDDECQSGLSCDGGMCRAPAGAGASCGGMSGVECRAGTLCLGAMGGMPGTCRATSDAFSAAAGASCDPRTGELCVEGQHCTLTTFMPPTTFAFTCEGPLAAGAACRLAFPDACPAGQICDANPFMGMPDGTCQPLPVDGQACASNRCADGHRCEMGTCRRVQGIGGACTTGEDCYSGNCDASVCAEGELCGP